MQKFNARGERLRAVSSRTMAPIMAHDWPRNIRELENSVEHAYVTSTSGRIERQFLPASLRRALGSEEAATAINSPAEGEAEQILETLKAHCWRKQEAARELGMSRTTQWRRMKELGLA
jgi:two-component system, NtrC family, response regulator HydG